MSIGEMSVIKRLKSGKEATAYCCRDISDGKYVLAKVYKDSGVVKNRSTYMYMDGRHSNAFSITKWIENEYKSLIALYEAGASVPKPYYMGGNAIYMEYIGSVDTPAPQIKKVRLDRKEAYKVLNSIVDNMKIFIRNNIIHADLSPYNILYWNDDIWVIDFPQAVDPRNNRYANRLLYRDVTNICTFLEQQGVKCNVTKIVTDIWNEYIYRDLY